MNLKNYKATDNNFWNGRVDDLHDVDSFRMHQVIKLLNLENINDITIDESKSNFCLLGYCSDEGIKRNHGRLGAKHGPINIRNKFASLPIPFCEETTIYDAGNLNVADGNMEEIQKQLEIAIEKILDKKLFPIVLGGSHDLSYGHFNGIFNYLKKKSDKPKIGIINFDAHFDIRPYDEQGSSGTMFAQIADNCAKENQEFNYLCVGVQKSGNTRRLFKKADSLGAKYILANEFIIDFDTDKISAQIQSFINENDYIYLTLCSDVFNAASAPGVSAMQPFGLKTNHVLQFIKEILKSKKVIAFDVAEVSPPLDDDNRTARLAATIIYAVISNLCGTL